MENSLFMSALCAWWVMRSRLSGFCSKFAITSRRTERSEWLAEVHVTRQKAEKAAMCSTSLNHVHGRFDIILESILNVAMDCTCLDDEEALINNESELL